MESWIAVLERGSSEAAWDRFLDQYRQLILATIHRYAPDYDDTMDVFARVCETLRANDFARLRTYAAQPHDAQCGTWVVAVVRHLTVDWLRHRHGRRRRPAISTTLSPLHQRILAYIFTQHRSHVETYELMRVTDGLQLSFGRFLLEVGVTYRAAARDRRAHLLRHLGVPQPISPADVIGQPIDVPIDYETRDAIDAALRRLPVRDRSILELYVLDELPANEVAAATGLRSAKAVYNRVYRSLATLREQLERDGIESRAG